MLTEWSTGPEEKDFIIALSNILYLRSTVPTKENRLKRQDIHTQWIKVAEHGA